MANQDINLSNLDTQLTEQDQAELQTFISQTQSRTEIQAKTHQMVNMCFKKCIPTIKSSTLTTPEEACLTNCVSRFFEISRLTVDHLAKSHSQ